MPATLTLAQHTRPGIYVEATAGQYATNVGYDLNDRGVRVRSRQRLTADPEEATLRHITLQREWSSIKARWPELRPLLLAGLPTHLARADLSKPFWPKAEWLEAGKVGRVVKLTAARDAAYQQAGRVVEEIVSLADTDRRIVETSQQSLGQTKDTLRDVVTNEAALWTHCHRLFAIGC